MNHDIAFIGGPATAGRSSVLPTRNTSRCVLWNEVLRIRELVAECEVQIRRGTTPRLPGNAAFLADGRVLCRDRIRGDSRYPYGSEGFNLWVTAAGYIHCNQGLFFVFLPAQSGEPPPIAFFAGVQLSGSEYLPHSLLPVPFLSDAETRVVDRYSVIGHDAAYFIAETRELLSVVRVFVDQTRSNHAHLHLSTLVQNISGRSLPVYTSAYMNPFCRHQFAESGEDRWFKQIRTAEHPEYICRERDTRQERGAILPPFVVKTNEDLSRFRSITNYALLRRAVSARNTTTMEDLFPSKDDFQLDPSDRDCVRLRIETEQCTSQLVYQGSPRRSLSSAAFLTAGAFSREVPLTVFNDNAIIGDLLRTELPTAAYLRSDYVFSTPENTDVVDLELSRPLGPAETDQAFERVRTTAARPGNLSMSFGAGSWNGLDSQTLNSFLPFLKKQVAVCATLKGYLQRSENSLIGFRDVFQAIEGHLFDRPAEAREKILEALSTVLIDGRCPRQYTLPVEGRPRTVDLRQFIDQGVWAISTVYSYLAVTGDNSILTEILGYQQVSEDKSLCEQSQETGSVLEHLLRIIDYLDRQRCPDTGLVLSLYGDWNDALDGLGVSDDPQHHFGTGVSIMTSLQLLQNFRELHEILQRFADEQYFGVAQKYLELADRLRENLLKFATVAQNGARRILHGWGDRRRYFVGSFNDCDGLARDGLTSNAFWVLADMLAADPTLKPHILAAFQRLDSPFGFRTFSPGFAYEATGVGRINRLPVGTAENGAAYLHATTFAIAALFSMGQPKQAWQQIAKIMPFAPHHSDLSHSPFVMPNSYLCNSQLNLSGQSMNDWQTGCSNVLLKLLIRYVFGFEPRLHCLRIAPADWLPFDAFEFQADARGKKVRISFKYDDVSVRRVTLNDVLMLETIADDRVHAAAVDVDYTALQANFVNHVAVVDPWPIR